MNSPYTAWLLHWKSTYIVKLFKLRIVEDEVHPGHLGKDGTITQGVSQCSQPWTDLGEVCAQIISILVSSRSQISSNNHLICPLEQVPTRKTAGILMSIISIYYVLNMKCFTCHLWAYHGFVLKLSMDRFSNISVLTFLNHHRHSSFGRTTFWQN